MMRVNDRKVSKPKRRPSPTLFKRLLDFLNGPRPKEANRIMVWIHLRKAANEVVEYNRILESVAKKPDGIDRDAIWAQASQSHELVLAGVKTALFGCTINVSPQSFVEKYSLLYSKKVELSDRQFLEGFRNLFVRDMPFLRCTPQHGQPALDFLALLTAPDVSMQRISKCLWEKCGRFFLAAYNRKQPYCNTKCRIAANNKAKKEWMKTYMQERRERQALRDYVIPNLETVDWKAEFLNWNVKHHSMKYGSVAKFRKAWMKEHQGEL